MEMAIEHAKILVGLGDLSGYLIVARAEQGRGQAEAARQQLQTLLAAEPEAGLAEEATEFLRSLNRGDEAGTPEGVNTGSAPTPEAADQ